MQIGKKTLAKAFLGVIFCIVLYWLLHEGERATSIFSKIYGIFSPFLIGAGIAFVLNVPTRAYERLLKNIKNSNLRRVLAIVLALVSVLLILTIVFLLLIPQLIETGRSVVPAVRDFIPKAETAIKRIIRNNHAVLDWINKNINLKNLFDNFVTILKNGGQKFLTGAVTAIGNIGGAIFDVVVAFVFAVYCLFQKETLARQSRKLLYALFPEKTCDEIVRISRLAASTFTNFMSGQCLEVCILGALFAVGMAIFRMPFIPIISVLIAVTAFVPIVGAWIGCFFGTFFILVADPSKALWFIVLFVVLQQIENNLIYPRVVGTSIGLSGMWVLVAVSVGGDLMGIAGMFIMIPIASVVYTLLSEFAHKRLKSRNIDPEKLKEQPPILRSKIKTRIQFNLSKRFAKAKKSMDKEKSKK